jgi:hypothetical protein
MEISRSDRQDFGDASVAISSEGLEEKRDFMWFLPKDDASTDNRVRLDKENPTVDRRKVLLAKDTQRNVLALYRITRSFVTSQAQVVVASVWQTPNSSSP